MDFFNAFSHLTTYTLAYRLADMKNSTLTERLIYAMAEKNLSQGGLAKAAGIAQPTINRLVKGTAKGSSKLVDIANALSVRADWLANGHGPMRDGIDKERFPELNESDRYAGITPVSIWIGETKTADVIWMPKRTAHSNTRAYRLSRNSGCAEAPAGTVVVVDTKELPGTGDYVFAKVNNSTSVYRFLDGGTSGFLSVDDERIPLIDIDKSAEIVGVIVFLLRDLSRRK